MNTSTLKNLMLVVFLLQGFAPALADVPLDRLLLQGNPATLRQMLVDHPDDLFYGEVLLAKNEFDRFHQWMLRTPLEGIAAGDRRRYFFLRGRWEGLKRHPDLAERNFREALKDIDQATWFQQRVVAALAHSLIEQNRMTEALQTLADLPRTDDPYTSVALLAEISDKQGQSIPADLLRTHLVAVLSNTEWARLGRRAAFDKARSLYTRGDVQVASADLRGLLDGAIKTEDWVFADEVYGALENMSSEIFDWTSEGWSQELLSKVGPSRFRWRLEVDSILDASDPKRAQDLANELAGQGEIQMAGWLLWRLIDRGIYQGDIAGEKSILARAEALFDQIALFDGGLWFGLESSERLAQMRSQLEAKDSVADQTASILRMSSSTERLKALVDLALGSGFRTEQTGAVVVLYAETLKEALSQSPALATRTYLRISFPFLYIQNAWGATPYQSGLVGRPAPFVRAFAERIKSDRELYDGMMSAFLSAIDEAVKSGDLRLEIDKRGDFINFLFLLGRYEEGLCQFEITTPLLRKFRLDMWASGAALEAGFYLNAAGYQDKALALFEEALQARRSEPDSSLEWAVLSQSYLQNDRPEDALRILDEYFASEPDENDPAASLICLRAQALHQMNRSEEALSYLSGARKKTPQETLFPLKRAEILLSLGEFEQVDKLLPALVEYRDGENGFRANRLETALRFGQGRKDESYDLDRRLAAEFDEYVAKAGEVLLPYIAGTELYQDLKAEFASRGRGELLSVGPRPPSSEKLTQAAFVEELGRIERRAPELANTRQWNFKTIQRIQAGLGPKSAAIQFFPGRESVGVIIVDAQSLWVDQLFLPEASWLPSLKKLSGLLSAPTTSAKEIEGLARSLSRLFLDSLGDRLCDYQALSFSLAGALDDLPLNLLSLNSEPLIGKSIVTLLLADQESPPWETPKTALFVGGSDDLPGTKAELRILKSRFSKVAEFRLGQSLETLGKYVATAQVLHVAAHGSEAGVELFPGLSTSDGRLASPLLSFLRLGQTQFVSLASCDSASGNMGLVSALSQAGASRILANQWTVDDQASTAFFANFYRQLSEGVLPARAFYSSVEEQRVAGKHPYFWAGLRLYQGI